MSQEELARFKSQKKRKERERKEQDLAARKQLANVRVVQKNLVYVLGLPLKIATEEALKSHDYFGQYGKILKIVVNKRNPTTATAAGSPSTVSTTANVHTGVYITFQRKEDAAKAIESVDGSVCEGRIIRATFGTTKYCSYFLKNQPCQNVGCQFLHEPGEETDTFVKDDAVASIKNVTDKEPQRLPQRPPAFPSFKRDEETPQSLPASSNWAKQLVGKQKQFPSSTGSSTDVFHDASERHSRQTSDVSSNNPLKRQDSGLQPAETVPEQNIQPECDVLGVKALVSDGEVDSLDDLHARIASRLRRERKQNGDDDYSSVDISDAKRRAEFIASLTCRLVPRYTGIFDPFRSDPFSPISTSLAAAQAAGSPTSSINGYASSAAGFPSHSQHRQSFSAAAGGLMHNDKSDGNEARKSRFEELFDANRPPIVAGGHDNANIASRQQRHRSSPSPQDSLGALFPVSGGYGHFTVPHGATGGNLLPSDLSRLSNEQASGSSLLISRPSSQNRMAFNQQNVSSAFLTNPNSLIGASSATSSSMGMSLRQQELLQSQQQQHQLNIMARLKLQQQQQQSLLPPHVIARLSPQQQQQLLNQPYSQQGSSSLNDDTSYGNF